MEIVNPAQVGMNSERLARITTHLTSHYIDPGEIVGCTTLVARNGKICYLEALGQADRQPRSEKQRMVWFYEKI